MEKKQEASAGKLRSMDSRIGNIRSKEFIRGWKAVSVEISGDIPHRLIEGRSLVDLRIYRARSGETYYAAAWLSLPSEEGKDRLYGAGSGRAGGWGYDKESAAAEEALECAGLRFAHHLGGSGLSGLEEAIRAVADLADEPYILVRIEP